MSAPARHRRKISPRPLPLEPMKPGRSPNRERLIVRTAVWSLACCVVGVKLTFFPF